MLVEWEINSMVMLEFCNCWICVKYFCWNVLFFIDSVLLMIKILGVMLIVIVNVSFMNILLE